MKHEVWMEGYLASGMEGSPAVATLLGTVEADTFAEACDKLCSPAEWQKQNGVYDRQRGAVCGCRLYVSWGAATKSREESPAQAPTEGQEKGHRKGGLLLKQLERVRRQIEWGAPRAPRGPLQVRESPLALQTMPAKRHKKRRNQTEAYHRRVQKKWTKRYGTKQVPTAYVLDNSVIGGYGQTLVAHPSIVARLKTPNVKLSRIQRREKE